MAERPILSIPIKTRGGFDGVIDGIESSDEDCIKGEIETANGKERVRWNSNGIARDKDSSCNINVKEIMGLSELIGNS
ncbi:hypothetical protein V6768_05540 [Tistrella mobilis]